MKIEGWDFEGLRCCGVVRMFPAWKRRRVLLRVFSVARERGFCELRVEW